MKLSVVALIGSILLGISGVIQALPDWSAILQPSTIAPIMTVIGGSILAWLGKSPIKPNGGVK